MNHETTILARLMAVSKTGKSNGQPIHTPRNFLTPESSGSEQSVREANEVVEAARQVAANGRTAVIRAADVSTCWCC